MELLAALLALVTAGLFQLAVLWFTDTYRVRVRIERIDHATPPPALEAANV
jgi:hypothetical protein